MTSDKHSKLVIEQTFGEKLEAWYEANDKWINVLLLVLIVGVGGYKLYQWQHTRSIEKANSAYAKVQKLINQSEQAQDAKQKVDHLQGAITAAEQVVSEYGNQFVGRQAQLLIGNLQYQIANDEPGEAGVANLEKARDSFKKYIGIASNSEEKAAGSLALGNVLENLGFIRSDAKLTDEAIAAYREAAKAGDKSYIGAQANLALANILISTKDASKAEEAKKLLAEIAKNRTITESESEATEKSNSVELATGQTLTPKQISGIKNQTAWSQSQTASDVLSRVN